MDDLIQAAQSLFVGRSDVYADAFPKSGKVGKVGYALVQQPFDDDVWSDHLAGRRLIGQYQLLPDSTVRWFALDFDTDDPEGDTILQQALNQQERFGEAGLQTYIERSRSGKGVHLWGFFSEPVPANDVRRALKPLLLKTSNFDRLYPVQVTISEAKPYGNLIALPFFGATADVVWSSPLGPGVVGGASVFINEDTLQPIEPMEFLRSVVLNNRAVIDELVLNLPPEAPDGRRDVQYDTAEAVAWGEVQTKGRPEKPYNGVLKLVSDYGCNFMRHAFLERHKLPEPQWYAAIQQLTCFKNGREAAHALSRGHPGYSPQETDQKYTQALRHPPVGCAYIHEHFPELACKGCAMKAPYHVADQPIRSLVRESEEPVIKSDYRASVARMRYRQNNHDDTGVLWRTAGLDQYTRLRPKELTVIGARPSVGKAQSLDSRVLTPTGWTTMGELGLGDEVITVTGRATTVIGVYPQGPRDMYRVTLSDGSSTECDLEHLWVTSTRNERRATTRPDWSVKTLREIIATLHRPDSDGQPNHALPVVAPVEFAWQPEDALPIDPYVLGALLGDGSFRGATYRLSNSEPDILEVVEEYLVAQGDRFGAARGVDRRIRGSSGKGVEPSNVRKKLDALGLGGHLAYDKFIPDAYLYASVGDRLALLRGLCDTDGSVTTGRTVEYTTSSERLKDGVVHLVRSLGGHVTVSDRTPYYSYDGERRIGAKSYRLFIRMSSDLAPVASDKHRERLRAVAREEHRSIVAVEYVGVKEAQCIAVEHPSHLYVTDDFIITHNTALVVDAAYNLAEAGTPVVFFSAETGQEGLEDRFLARASGVDSRAIRGERTTAFGQLVPITDEEIRRVEEAARHLASLPIYTHYTASNADLMLNLVEDMLLRDQIDLSKPLVLIFDYLQFTSMDKMEAGFNEYEYLSRACQEFKYLAKVLRQPVVLLSQLKRDAEGDETPSLDAFKGTGRIEADADVAMILSGDRIPGPVAKRKLTIVKQREGDAGVTIDLLLHQAVCRFEPHVLAVPSSAGKDIFGDEPDSLPF